MRLLPCFVAVLLLPACAPAETATEGDLSGTTYYEMTTRLSSADLARWDADRAKLVDSFYAVCGDTFCSGDYSNLSTVALTCSITQAGYVKECTWVLGGSIEYVDGATGKFTIDARTFSCTVPVQSKSSVFFGALEQSSKPVHQALPATGRSFYDGIGDCLSGVVGNAPPASTGTTYEELADYFNDKGDPGDWYGTRDGLVGAFDGACADTFCKDSWKDIAALRFVCATKQATGDVVGCRWSFGAVNPTVTKKGHVSGTAKILQCPISVKGSAADVEKALSSADPLHAPLPGSAATLAVQLDACL